MADTTIVISAKDETAAAFQAISGNIRGFDGGLQGLLGPLGGVYGAMTALAGTLGLVKFASAIGESIEFAASLKNMSEKSGASVETLAQIAPAASIAGVGMDSVAGAVTKLSKSMADSDDTTKGAGKALQTLGLTARDSNGQLKDAGALYIEIANKLSGYADGAGKTAIAMTLLGKAGAEQIPVMNDFAEAQKYAVAVTDEQAAAADEYEKNLTRLGLAQSAIAKIIGIEVAPVMSDFVKVMLDSATGAGGLKDSITGLAADGSIRTWAQQAAIGIAYVVDAFDGVVRAVDIVGKAVAAGVAQIVEMFSGIGSALTKALSGDFSGAAAAVKDSFGKIKTIGGEFVVDFDAIMGKSTFSDRLKAQFAASNAEAGKASETTKKLGLDYTATSEKADKYAEAMKKLVTGIEDGNAKLRVELEMIGKDAVARERANVELDREKALRDVTSAAARNYINALFDERAELVQSIQAKKDQKAAMDEYVKALIKEGEESIKAYDAQLKLVEGIQKEVAGLKLETEMFGMTKLQAALYSNEKDRAAKLSGVLDDNIRTNINTLYDERAALIVVRDGQEQAAKATQDWQKIIEEADKVGYDFFQAMGDGMDGIKDWARNAGDALKKYLLSALYELTAKPFVVSIMTSLTGAGALTSTAANAGGLPSITGGGGGLGSIFNAFTGGFGSGGGLLGAAGGFGAAQTAALDSMLIGGGLESMAGGALTSILGPAMAAAPWAALAAVAVPMILKAFQDGPAMRTGDFVVGGATGAIDANSPNRGASAFGKFGVANGQWFSDADMGAAMSAMMKGITGIDNALSQRLGSSTTSLISGGLTGGKNYEFGMEHTDLNASGVVGSIMKDRYVEVFDLLDKRLGAVVAGFEGTGEELGKFVLTLADVYTATQTLPSDVGGALLDVLAAGTLTIDEIGRFATAYVGLQSVLNVDPAAAVLDALSKAQETNYDRVIALRGGLEELVKTYDGGVDSTEQLYAATSDYVRAQIVALAQIEEMSDALAGMFKDSRTEIEQFFWNNTQRADYLMSEVAATTDLLADTFDPTQINEYAKVINSDLMQAFKLLSPEEQKAQQADFLRQINDTDELVKARLDASRQEIAQDNANAQTVLGEIRTALDAAAQSLAASAELIHTSSQIMASESANNQAAQIAIAQNTGKTAKILQQFDGDGMPATRSV
jgi:hypothetical protein